MSRFPDVSLPVYVARAQVASAINLIVQLDRFSADGSRKVTRVTEVIGLAEGNQYEFRDLLAIQLRGQDSGGRVQASLIPTGELPTFASQPYEHGLGRQLRHSRELWRE
jgi:pilus assembly protein CpaF